MNFKEFFMKWRFRLDQARALFTILAFAALMAVDYVKYISAFDRLGFWGVVILTLIIFVGFGLIGYFYDKIFKLWSETNVVNIKRNPYTYVPHPKEYLKEMVKDYFFLKLFKQMNPSFDISEYEALLQDYYALSPQTPDFDKKASDIHVRAKKIILDIMENDEINL